MTSNVTTRVLGTYQRKAKIRAAELLLATGLGRGQVASENVTRDNINEIRSWGVPAEVARRFHETYVVAYLDDEMVGVARYFPDLQLAFHVAVQESRPDDVATIATRPRLSHFAVIPQLRGRGIGTILLAAAEDAARLAGDEVMWGFAEASVESGRKPTPEENERLFSFYSNCGYSLGGTPTEAPPEIFGRPMTAQQERVGAFFWKTL